MNDATERQRLIDLAVLALVPHDRKPTDPRDWPLLQAQMGAVVDVIAAEFRPVVTTRTQLVEFLRGAEALVFPENIEQLVDTLLDVGPVETAPEPAADRAHPRNPELRSSGWSGSEQPIPGRQ